jgi:hypothetical protein
MTTVVARTTLSKLLSLGSLLDGSTFSLNLQALLASHTLRLLALLVAKLNFLLSSGNTMMASTKGSSSSGGLLGSDAFADGVEAHAGLVDVAFELLEEASDELDVDVTLRHKHLEFVLVLSDLSVGLDVVALSLGLSFRSDRSSHGERNRLDDERSNDFSS